MWLQSPPVSSVQSIASLPWSAALCYLIRLEADSESTPSARGLQDLKRREGRHQLLSAHGISPLQDCVGRDTHVQFMRVLLARLLQLGPTPQSPAQGPGFSIPKDVSLYCPTLESALNGICQGSEPGARNHFCFSLGETSAQVPSPPKVPGV